MTSEDAFDTEYTAALADTFVHLRHDTMTEVYNPTRFGRGFPR